MVKFRPHHVSLSVGGVHDRQCPRNLNSDEERRRVGVGGLTAMTSRPRRPRRSNTSPGGIDDWLGPGPRAHGADRLQSKCHGLPESLPMALLASLMTTDTKVTTRRPLRNSRGDIARIARCLTYSEQEMHNQTPFPLQYLPSCSILIPQVQSSSLALESNQLSDHRFFDLARHHLHRPRPGEAKTKRCQ